MLQTHFQLLPAAQRSDQNIPAGPVDFRQFAFDPFRQRRPFKGGIRRIGDQLIEHLRDQLGRGGQERQSADVHPVNTLIKAVLTVFFLVLIREQHIGTKHRRS